MSGYLERLAARAGGAPAAAVPRVPSRFEPGGDERSTDAATRASVEEQPAALAQAAPPIPILGVGAPSPVVPVGAGATEDDATATAAPTDPAHQRREATHAGPAGAAAAPALAIPGAPVPLELGEAAVAHPLVVAPPPADRRVEATPVRREGPQADEAPARRTSPRDAASVPASEPDVVHVTIGRVEVRATVTAPAAATRAAGPPRDPERSLHDYLTGRPR